MVVSKKRRRVGWPVMGANQAEQAANTCKHTTSDRNLHLPIGNTLLSCRFKLKDCGEKRTKWLHVLAQLIG
jgi:hypothetical protein